MWVSAVRSAMFVPSRAAFLAPRASLFTTPPSIAQRVRFSSTNVPEEAEEQPHPTSAGPLPIRYPYFVSRVGVNGMNLPVYTDIRNARSRYLTNIRKVEGDVTALCRDLFEDFGWGDPFNKLNPNAELLVRTTQQAGSKMIVIRGNWSRDVKAWLEERGF
ncbi:uncharacterized protein MJAP1_000474 [Malassezia japonica]|uniref:Large ribosomal subunit protein mL49 n=1 Tax=Malassezia japonica TaxID=223818 RepID=A0AAF0J8W8_9BASI|nr:uncharacterized protein MJAP1_000474 [Malassezia japonica]WFD37530.1 hypothetical protein MJAP1_000474 [Malassezia japonica]